MSLTESSPEQIAKAASVASTSLAILPSNNRNDALTAIHRSLSQAKESILAANAHDVAYASQAAADGELSQSILKRLDLSRPGKWDEMLQGILDVRELEDPGWIACPIGVLLIIFEARPEVIANIAALAIKSGNAAILKGGRESTASFLAISRAISSALRATAVPNAAIQLVITRDDVAFLLKCDKYIDLVIPRGSNELVRTTKERTRIPVLGHADGLCSIYIHPDADLQLSVRVVTDSKLDYPAACNSVETLLVHQEALDTHLPAIATALLERGCSLRCDAASLTALSTALPAEKALLLQAAADEDYDTEFLSPILAIKTVVPPDGSTDEIALTLAIAHINSHSSHHTDAILTSSPSLAKKFKASVASACVFSNTSTRMADGMRFGFGTEVGISTNKIHARGPVGLEGLCIYKYVIDGSGHVAGDYGGAGGKKWRHERLPLD
ncbi:MAG: hypothetical protein LQ345_006028 [Seirophora villosa]|nr:MAG: hypothetical protein LQ345_006028 [Seirophora villosa]